MLVDTDAGDESSEWSCYGSFRGRLRAYLSAVEAPAYLLCRNFGSRVCVLQRYTDPTVRF
jgi:hypothetical protein